MRKKKGLTAVLAMILALSMALGAWGAEKKEAYTYTSGTVQIRLGQDWNEVHKAMGKETAVTTLMNCANGGSDKMYSYPDCDLYTSQNAKKKLVVDMIELKGDAATEEGLKLGQKPADVKKLYPAATESYGLYEVTLGDSKLVIDCGYKNTAVERITYELVPETK